MAIPRAQFLTPQNGGIVALLISPLEPDHATLQRLSAEQGWTLYVTTSLGSASILLKEKPASVVLTEKDLPTGNWKDVLDAVRALPDPPFVVVSSEDVDDYLWAEALNLGAYDVLAKPLDSTEVILVFTSAWLRYRQASRDRHARGVRSANSGSSVNPKALQSEIESVPAV